MLKDNREEEAVQKSRSCGDSQPNPKNHSGTRAKGQNANPQFRCMCAQEPEQADV